jgi:hypothetical protein
MVNRAARGAALGAVLGCALLIGCTSDPKVPQPPAEIQIVHQDANNMVIETQPMMQVPLIPPPQGGWIVLLGVRAKNIDSANATLTTALVDSCDSQIIQIDKRPTKLEMGADGWAVSSLTTFGNLPVCPQLTATRDLHDVPYLVKVSVEDTAGQKATAEVTVVPTCPTEASRCTCECDRDYVVGAECPVIVTPHGTCNTAD